MRGLRPSPYFASGEALGTTKETGDRYRPLLRTHCEKFARGRCISAGLRSTQELKGIRAETPLRKQGVIVIQFKEVSRTTVADLKTAAGFLQKAASSARSRIHLEVAYVALLELTVYARAFSEDLVLFRVVPSSCSERANTACFSNVYRRFTYPLLTSTRITVFEIK